MCIRDRVNGTNKKPGVFPGDLCIIDGQDIKKSEVIVRFLKEDLCVHKDAPNVFYLLP